MILNIPTDPKMLRETLCRAQQGLDLIDSKRIGMIISAIDVIRPLGPDGKHGDMHTLYCGCDQ